MVFFPLSSGFWLPFWCLLFLTQSENVTAILNFESLRKVTTLLLEYFWQCRRLHIKSKIFQAIRGQGGHLGFRIAHKRHNTSSGPFVVSRESKKINSNGEVENNLPIEGNRGFQIAPNMFKHFTRTLMEKLWQVRRLGMQRLLRSRK